MELCVVEATILTNDCVIQTVKYGCVKLSENEQFEEVDTHSVPVAVNVFSNQ